MNCRCDVFSGGPTIETTVTCKGKTIKQWIRSVEEVYEFKETVIVGLDIEWRPNRRFVNNPPATMQLCVGHRCLIIQLLYNDYLPNVLCRFLSSDKYIFAGVGVANDTAKLEEVYGLKCVNVYDVKLAVMESWPERFSSSPGLKEIASEVANVWLEKPRHVTMSDWEQEELSYAQVEYACLDAYASCRTGVKLFFSLYDRRVRRSLRSI